MSCSFTFTVLLLFSSLLILSAGKAALIFASFNFANSLSGKEKSTMIPRGPPGFASSEEGLGNTKPLDKLCSCELSFKVTDDCSALHFMVLLLLCELIPFFGLDCFDLYDFVFFDCVE